MSFSLEPSIDSFEFSFEIPSEIIFRLFDDSVSLFTDFEESPPVNIFLRLSGTEDFIYWNSNTNEINIKLKTIKFYLGGMLELKSTFKKLT